MEKCLGADCPHQCCSNKFQGLSSALKNNGDEKFAQIKLSAKEEKRIKKAGYSEYLEYNEDGCFVKLNEDMSCQAYENGRCKIYYARPDVCRMYPYYFDPFCGICVDKRCPGGFSVEDKEYKKEVYKILKKRIKYFSKVDI